MPPPRKNGLLDNKDTNALVGSSTERGDGAEKMERLR